MSSKRESVAGCIRRLRNKLKAAGNGMVTIGYADLMVSLDAIETAHKAALNEKSDENVNLKVWVSELGDSLSEAIEHNCSKCTFMNTRESKCKNRFGVCSYVEKWRKALEYKGLSASVPSDKGKDVKELRASLERAINIICGKCYDKVRAKCARGEKKDCEVFALRKAFAEGEKK